MDLSENDTHPHSNDIGGLSENFNELLQKDSICLDLSHQSLQRFLLSSTACNSHLQFLYLQGNLIEKLASDFFSSLPFLRHLDLRQNKLSKIPVSIAGHNCLEVLLLQDNQLSLLPCELGQVPQLRKFQFSGNPLSWPPEKILSQGLGTILSFLRGAYMDQLSRGDEDKIPKADGYDCTKGTGKSWMAQAAHKPSFKKTVLLDEPNSPSSSSSEPKKKQRKNIDGMFLLKGQSKQLKHRTCSSASSSGTHELKTPSLQPYVLPGHAQAIMNGQCYPLGYKKRSSPSTAKICRTLLQKLWLNQLKCVLQSQEDILQRFRTSEALRQWREGAKIRPRSRSQLNWSGLDLPYDFDPDYLQMVPRSDWQMFQNMTLENRGHSKPKVGVSPQAKILQEQIDQILQSFDAMQSTHDASHSMPSDTNPSTRCKLLAEEMKRISHLQKAVQALRLSV